MNFAKRTYQIAAVYGLIVMAPQYFMEGKIGRDYPPPITHPEQFYGFVGVVLVWQLVFLLIASDPPRYRPLMPLSVLEKLAFGVPAVVLYLQGRVATAVLGAGTIDLVLGSLFLIAYRRTSPKGA